MRGTFPLHHACAQRRNTTKEEIHRLSGWHSVSRSLESLSLFFRWINDPIVLQLEMRNNTFRTKEKLVPEVIFGHTTVMLEQTTHPSSIYADLGTAC